MNSKTKSVVTKPKPPVDVTFEEVNDSYMDGCLPIVDSQVVLLGCKGLEKLH